MSETKVCQNCKSSFIIEPEDLLFYEKIKVPPPTWCPECRFTRRQAFHDMFKLYKRSCDLCKKEFISRYSQDKPYKVYCPACWWSDKWDPMDYGRNYDFLRPFFEQYADLIRSVPRLGLSVMLDVALNSPYNNHAGNLKQCYLTFDGDFNERCMYGYFVSQSKDCCESSFIGLCELCYDSFHGFKNYNCIHLDHSIMSNDSTFLWQCTSCQNCFASANLRSKQYHFFNTPYSKEDYGRKIREIDLGSYKTYSKVKEEARAHWLNYPAKTFWHEFSRDTSGLYVFSSKNCKKCFEVTGAEDCKYITFVYPGFIKDSYDVTSFGNNIQSAYESIVVGYNANNIKFADESGVDLFNATYVETCIGASSYLFGCTSLKDRKSYCILNKQYTKEEYNDLVSKIVQHMNEMPFVDKKGRVYKYGEFPPIELSLLAYNETLAQRYYPLTKKEALANGYLWKEEEINEYQVTLSARDLPDHIRDCTDKLLEEILGCITCGRAYRLISQELEFYKKMNVPVPRSCFVCRLEEKLKNQPHPMKFWKRKCQCSGKASENEIYKNMGEHFHGSSHCPNEFETSYAPERPEIVYCEQCYQAEVQ